jgi:peroxiredoxin Q/BCP
MTEKLGKGRDSMSDIQAGLAAPDFSLPATGNAVVSLGEQRGHKVILFFYPKDNTAG